MTQDELIQLAEKVAHETASPEEELILAQEMEKGLVVLQELIKTAKATQNHA